MSDSLLRNSTMKYTGIILDVDGTIWNTTPLTAAAWNKAIASCRAPVPLVTDAILKTQFGKTMDVIADNLFSGVIGEKRSELLKCCYQNEHEALVENTKDITYDGVVKTIAKLHTQIPFYVVSNCQKGYIELMLEKTGMTSFVTDTECFGNTGKGKADNIALLVQRNHIEKPVYVGDTQGDCDSCKQAGVPFMWASYGFGTADLFVAKLQTFSEIKKYIA